MADVEVLGLERGEVAAGDLDGVERLGEDDTCEGRRLDTVEAVPRVVDRGAAGEDLKSYVADEFDAEGEPSPSGATGMMGLGTAALPIPQLSSGKKLGTGPAGAVIPSQWTP